MAKKVFRGRRDSWTYTSIYFKKGEITRITTKKGNSTRRPLIMDNTFLITFKTQPIVRYFRRGSRKTPDDIPNAIEMYPSGKKRT